MIKEELILTWVKNKRRDSDRLNRINKRIKKYLKQKKHFEMRAKVVQEYERQTVSKTEK